MGIAATDELFEMANLAVHPVPPMVAGRLAAGDERSVTGWIRLGEAILVAYRTGEIDTVRPIQDLDPLRPAP